MPPDATEREADLRFVVRGRVQGVGFRAWTRHQARNLGITGRVDNQPDGSVQLLARGTVAALDELHRLLESGPPLARVDQVTRDLAFDVDRTDFVIGA